MAIYFLPPLKTKLKKPPTDPSAHSQSTATCDRPLLVMHLWEGENTRNTMDNNVLVKPQNVAFRAEQKLICIITKVKRKIILVLLP